MIIYIRHSPFSALAGDYILFPIEHRRRAFHYHESEHWSSLPIHRSSTIHLLPYEQLSQIWGLLLTSLLALVYKCTLASQESSHHALIF